MVTKVTIQMQISPSFIIYILTAVILGAKWYSAAFAFNDLFDEFYILHLFYEIVQADKISEDVIIVQGSFKQLQSLERHLALQAVHRINECLH